VTAVLRDVVEADLDVFFEHQREPEAKDAQRPALTEVIG